MVSSSSIAMRKEGKEVMNVKMINNDVCDAPKFKAITKIAYKGDPVGALSSIPPKVLMMNDVRNFYICNIEEIRDLEIRKTYAKLCSNGVLKDEFKIIEKKC